MTEHEEKMALLAEIAVAREIRDREYALSCWDWACEQVQTVDEATQQVRRWPVDKPYLKELFEIYESEQLIALPKSRRLMVSWSVALWATWRARYHPHNAIFIQSDVEAKSAYLIDKRCKFVEDNQVDHEWIKRPYYEIRTTQGLVGKMTYPGTKSYVHGVAQGADKIRSYTASALIMDECEFQSEAHAALTAAIALVEDTKSVKLILISTSNGPGGVLASICRDVGFVKWS